MGGLSGVFPKVMKRLPFFAAPEKAARGPVYMASSPELAGGIGPLLPALRGSETKSITHEAGVSEWLWHVSEELCGAQRGGPVTGDVRVH